MKRQKKTTLAPATATHTPLTEVKPNANRAANFKAQM